MEDVDKKRVIHILTIPHQRSLLTWDTLVMNLSAVVCFDSPIGQIAIGATDRGISEITILGAGEKRAEFQTSPLAAEYALDAWRQLQGYFQGENVEFKLRFDLDGTEFQRQVWQQISQIPQGESLSYGQIATRIGKPKAARAVGGAVGQNPVPIVIGCHRVLGSSRTLTGYSGGGGLDTKRWLLNFEQIEYRK